MGQNGRAATSSQDNYLIGRAGMEDGMDKLEEGSHFEQVSFYWLVKQWEY